MKLKITLTLFIIMLFAYQTSAQCSADFEETNGIAILEMETKTAGSFSNEVMTDASEGRGIAYRGTDYFSTPGNSTITYTVEINSPGTYRFIWRNKIGVVASSNASTEHNDAWLKINGSDFYGEKSNGSIIYPGGSGKTPTPNGASSDGWFKVYANNLDWNWDTYTSDHDGHFVYADFDSAGTYTIQVSGRSSGHFIDRMVLYKEGSYTSTQAQDLARAETPCSDADTTTTTPTTTTPEDNVSPTVSFSNISDGDTFTAGSNLTIGLSSNDSDGSISQHKVYVNGTLVDTDGSSYSSYVVANITSGNYTLTATVTDNSGASTSATIDITVGSVEEEEEEEETIPTTTTPTTPEENEAPSVSFSTLTDGQQVTTGSTVSIALSSNDTDGSVVKHQIYVNGVLVDTDGVSYTPHPIAIQSGSYSITATVTDNDGATASASISISTEEETESSTPTTTPTDENAAPTVSFSSLSDGQEVTADSTIYVSLSTSDSDGTVVKHQIYVNGTLVDTDGASYTAHPIRDIQDGNYTIRAVVTDNDGATGEASIDITVGADSESESEETTTSDSISFNVIDASTNSTISSISNGTILESAQGVNIVAIVPSDANSVRLTLSGSQSVSRLESVSPYALYGDNNGDYFTGDLSTGTYTIRAIAYSGNSGSGSVLADTSVSFSVSSSSTSAKSAFAYPNPVKDDGKVSINIDAKASEQYEYSVSNSLGVVIDNGLINTSASQTNLDLQLSNVVQSGEGVFYITLLSSTSIQTIPIIRE